VGFHINKHNSLYLRRYWDYEQCLISKLCVMKQNVSFTSNLDDLLDSFFDQKLDLEIDWQREAAKYAVNQSFTIITSGPRTGKTTTVVKILALLQQINTEKPLYIALAAPTGKAAMRLQESITQSKLVASIKPSARLILLDDKEQLASVESGTVLADLVEALPKNTITLKKTYRFKDEIKAFAEAINQKRCRDSMGINAEKKYSN
jgi:ATP-dependent exoDNAse (exonuclease V) alpha subunit